MQSLWSPMILIAISYHGREWKRGDRGRSPRKNLAPRLFHLKETSLLIWRGSFCSFAEKGRDLDPRTLHSCAPMCTVCLQKKEKQ